MAYTTIKKPGDYFNNKIYTGNSGTQALTGVGFQPDMTWIKRRGSAEDHALFDAVRGVTKRITPSRDYAESTDAQGLTAFGTDGFTVGSSDAVNGSDNYASWNWKAGTGQGSSNTDGSINTTYTSVNTTAGFSISSYTGTGSNATVGHGLGVAPKMIIIRSTSNTSNWGVYHKSIGANKMLNLNTTAAEATNSGYFNNTDPTTTVFSLGDEGNDTNGSGKNYIAYCFAEKTGYSKFGSYVGNGNANGTFVYTGFKPAWVMRKYATGGSASGEGWEMLDSARSPFNVADERLKADSNGAESTGSNYYVDFLSNGFKCRTADNATNNSGATYIYMAFAEEPLVANSGTDGVPATAR